MKSGFDQTVGKKWEYSICVVDVMLFGRKDTMADGKREIVICRCSFDVKCHCKCHWWRREVRMAAEFGDNVSFDVASFRFSLSSLLPSQTCSVLPLLLILRLLSAKFLTATNISPRGQDLPPHMHARAHAFACYHPLTSFLHSHNPNVSACLLLRDNWCENKEREAKLRDLFMCYCLN